MDWFMADLGSSGLGPLHPSYPQPHYQEQVHEQDQHFHAGDQTQSQWYRHNPMMDMDMGMGMGMEYSAGAPDASFGMEYPYPAMATPRQSQPGQQHQHQKQQLPQQRQGIASDTTMFTPPHVDKKHTPDLDSKRAAVVSSLQKQRGGSQPSSAEEGGGATNTKTQQGQNSKATTTTATTTAATGAAATTQAATKMASDKPTQSSYSPNAAMKTATTARRASDERSSTGSNPASATAPSTSSSNGHGQSPDGRAVAKPAQPRASAADIDGLLAESKAAAESAVAKKEKTVAAASASPVSKRNTTTATASNNNNTQHNNPNPQRLQATESGKKLQQQVQQRVQQSEDMRQHKSNGTEQTHKSRTSLGNKDNNTSNEGYDHHHDGHLHQSEQKRLRHHTSGVLPDRPLYEPPQRSAGVSNNTYHNAQPSVKSGTSIKLDNKSTATKSVPTGPSSSSSSSTRQPPSHRKELIPPPPTNPDNEFPQLQPEELDELREWLEVTGYNDQKYRRETLASHREKAEKARLAKVAALEQEIAALKKQGQNERGGPSTGAGAAGGGGTRIDLARRALQLEYATSEPDEQRQRRPPAPSGRRGPMGSDANALPVGPKSKTDDDHHLHHEGYTSGSGSYYNRRQKRDYSNTIPSHDDDHHGRLKMARANSTEHIDDESYNHHHEGYAPSKRGRGSGGQYWPRGGRGARGGYHYGIGPPRDRGYYQEQQSDDGDDYADYRHRDAGTYAPRGRGRGGRYMGHTPRGSMRSSGMGMAVRHRLSGGSLELQYDNTRFFLIKSNTYENVEDSQQEGIWATQFRNVKKLADAYNSCENVILVFSVNASKAFQGYARMESLPDSQQVPAPSWAGRQDWKESPPFRLNWINIAVTDNRGLGHLKNAYNTNENKVVMFGRDGQEIEPMCGLELCSLLDDNSNKLY